MELFFKGIIIGFGKIIPGVSGSVLAIRMNIYEHLIDSINNLFTNFRKNICFLFKVALGILVAIIFGSKFILYLMNNYYYITKILFVILIITGIPIIIKEVDNYFIVVLSFFIYCFILFILNINIDSNYFVIGFLEAFSTIVPGISGTALFMSLGVYDEYLSIFSNISIINFNILIPFILGLLIGSLIIIRFINYCFKRYRSKTYSVILGLLLGSILLMIIKK